MKNTKNVFKSKKLGYASTCILVLLFLLSVFLPLSRTSSNNSNSNNTSVSSNKKDSGVGAINGVAQEIWLSKSTTTYYQINARFPYAVGETGEPSISSIPLTSCTIDNTVQDGTTAGPSSTSVQWYNNNANDCVLPSGMVSLYDNYTLSTDMHTGTACDFSGGQAARRASLVTSTQSATLYAPYWPLKVQDCDIGDYVFGWTITYNFRVLKTVNCNWGSFPTIYGIPSSAWTLFDFGSYHQASFDFKFNFKIHILADTTGIASITPPSAAPVGTVGTASTQSSANLYRFTQKAYSSTDPTAKFSFVSIIPSTSHITLSATSSTAVTQIYLNWDNTTPIGKYTIKLKALSQLYSGDQPELETTLTIKYLAPNSVDLSTTSASVVYNDASGAQDVPAVFATAKSSAATATNVLQDFTWSVENPKKDGSTISELPEWMEQEPNGDGTASVYYSLDISFGSVGLYTFTLRATTTSTNELSNYATKTKTIDISIDIVPNITTLALSTISTITGKSHEAGQANSSTQTIEVTTAPYQYDLSPVWSFNTILKNGGAFDNGTGAEAIFKINNGLISWTNSVLSGTYNIKVAASYTSTSGAIVGYSDCVVEIALPASTFANPAITYSGKKEFFGSINHPGSFNKPFVACLNQIDAAPVTFSLEKASGDNFPAGLSIGEFGTVSWDEGTTAGDYCFYIKATTNNPTPDENYTEYWKDNGASKVSIDLHISTEDVDDVSLTSASIDNCLPINVTTTQTGSSAYDYIGQVTHKDADTDYNFSAEIVSANPNDDKPTWLTTTTVNPSTGKFKIQWSNAVKGSYDVRIHLTATVGAYNYGYLSPTFTFTVSDFKPNEVTLASPGVLQAQVGSAGQSTTSQKASATFALSGGSTTNVEQSANWSIATIKNPNQQITTEPTISLMNDNTFSWTALDMVGNWTFSLKATSTVNSVNAAITVTINVATAIPDSVSIDSSNMLPSGAYVLTRQYGNTAATSSTPTVITSYSNHNDWADNTVYTKSYSLVMENGASAADAGLSLVADEDVATGAFAVSNAAKVGTYHFHISLQLKIDGVPFLAPQDTYSFTLNITLKDPYDCVFKTQVPTSTPLNGYLGWSGETATAGSDRFTAENVDSNNSPINVLQDSTFGIIMTDSTGFTNGNSVPSWLAIGPYGEIEWDHPNVTGKFYFKVRAYSLAFNNADEVTDGFYTLTITAGTTPQVVEITNQNDFVMALSSIEATAGEAGSIDTNVQAVAVGNGDDPYYQTGIIYSLTSDAGSTVPSWLHIDATTGLISWDADWVAGNYQNINVRATSTADPTIFDEVDLQINIGLYNAPTNGTGLSQLTMILIVGIPAAIILLGGSIWFLSRKHISGGLKKKR